MSSFETVLSEHFLGDKVKSTFIIYILTQCIWNWTSFAYNFLYDITLKEQDPSVGQRKAAQIQFIFVTISGV